MIFAFISGLTIMSYQSSTSLDSFKWYHAIHQYSRPFKQEQAEDQEMDEPELGPDGDLLPPMVSAVVIPNIVKAFESGAYDVYSARQTRRVVDLVDLVSVYTGKDNAKFRVRAQFGGTSAKATIDVFACPSVHLESGS
jgi:GC-rich sequence DNA-binding factor